LPPDETGTFQDEHHLMRCEEALLAATACSHPPAGRARWTLELLAGELARLTGHDSLSRETPELDFMHFEKVLEAVSINIIG
jgi:hypothetical protein